MKPEQLLSNVVTSTQGPRLVAATASSIEPVFAPLLAGVDTPDDGPLLVVDTTQMSLAQFEGAAKVARACLERNRAVLILRPTRAHKRALAAAGVTRHYADTDTVALLVEPRRDAAGCLRPGLVEQYPTMQCTAILVCDGDGPVVPSEPGDVARATRTRDPEPDELTPFADHLRAVLARLATGESLPLVDATSGFAQPNQPPATLPSNLWNAQPITWYQPIILSNPYPFADGGKPPTGTAIWQGVATVGVYYDNTSYSHPVQWLLIEHSASLSLPYNTATGNGLLAQNDYDQGWSIGAVQVGGTDISASNMASNQSSPENANNVQSYTSSSSFNVGVSLGTGGGDVSFGYTVGSSVTKSISDWAVQKTAPDSWTFFQQIPFDGRITNAFPPGADGKKGSPVFVGAISAGELDICAQTVWLRRTADTATMYNAFQFPMNFFWYHVDHRGNNPRDGMAFCLPAWYATYYIDFGAAYPTN